MGLFAVFALGVSVYAATQMLSIDDNYSGLLSDESAASVALARANRSVQTYRATLGELMMATREEDLASAKKEMDGARSRFLELFDEAIKALPADDVLPQLKNETVRVADSVCGDLVSASLNTTDAVKNQDIQKRYFENCRPEFRKLSDAIIANTRRVIEAASVESQQLSSETSSAVTTLAIGIFAGLIAVCASAMRSSGQAS
jgi:methyl-accepting chemotaxis protein